MPSWRGWEFLDGSAVARWGNKRVYGRLNAQSDTKPWRQRSGRLERRRAKTKMGCEDGVGVQNSGNANVLVSSLMQLMIRLVACIENSKPCFGTIRECRRCPMLFLLR